MSNVSEYVVWNRVEVPGHMAMRIGTEAQVVLSCIQCHIANYTVQ